jgi:cell division transport system ATP-binding protein
MIRLQNITKTFGAGNTALDDVTFHIDKGEFTFVVGPSGSGKTTLFRLITRETTPTSGSVHIGQWDIGSLDKKHIPTLRKKIGVIFQDLKMLKDRTIYENILLPLEVAGIQDEDANRKIDEVLEKVGILEHKEKFPIQLSGGELQRAAIARALAFGPEILLADEPTGNLDNTTTWEIVKLLQDINQEGTTIMMASHNADVISNLAKRTIVLEKGKVVDDQRKEKKNK